jgi:hypothetical protein
VSNIGYWMTWISVKDNPPSSIWIVIALAIGMALAINPATWSYTRLFATYIHEVGHAILAIVTGRRVTAMHIEANSSGSTEHFGSARVGPSLFLTAIAGYPAPAIVGLAMMASVSSSHPRYTIVAMAITIVALALVQHSLRGWAVSLIALAVCAFLIFIGGGIIASEVIALLSGYLLIASPRTIVELHRIEAFRRKNPTRLDDTHSVHSDAAVLATMTGLGIIVWEMVFMLTCVACLWQVFRLI